MSTKGELRHGLLNDIGLMIPQTLKQAVGGYHLNVRTPEDSQSCGRKISFFARLKIDHVF
jgi:hypothetical protein